MSDPTLYRMFDATGTLLYIGKTISPPQRLRAHDREKDWFVDVADIRLERFQTEEEVLTAERAAIISEKPMHNIVHNSHVGSRRAGRSPSYSYLQAPLSFAEAIIQSDAWQPIDQLPPAVAGVLRPDAPVNFVRPHGSPEVLKSITHFKTLDSAVQFALGYAHDKGRTTKASGWFPESDVWVVQPEENCFLTVPGENTGANEVS